MNHEIIDQHYYIWNI